MDITLAPWTLDSPVDAGPMVLHRPDCPVVQVLRAEGKPLLTMFEVDCDLDKLAMAKHTCLDPEQDEPR
jgi:hypothetical protein